MSKKIYCSFCGKHQDEVEILIVAKDKLFICNECVDVCNKVITEHKAKKAVSDV